MKLPSTIQTIIFDLDNTLIDRDAAMKTGIGQWLKDQETVDETKLENELNFILQKDNSGYTDTLLLCEWLLDNYGCVQTKNNTTPKELLIELQHFAIANLQPNPEILNTLHHLKQHYQLVIATNGSQYAQQKKIEQSKLQTVFSLDHIYISETMGCSKPDQVFFNQLLSSIKQVPEQCLMVGDHYINDIEGAKRCGIYTLWITKETGTIHPSADGIFNHIIEIRQWIPVQL